MNGNSFQSIAALLSDAENSSTEVFQFLKEWFNNNDFVVAQTSGSTGNPKSIQLQKKHMVNSAKATGKFFKLSENTTALLCMSPNFIAGKMMLVRALVLGWDLSVVEPNSNPLKDIKTVDFAAMVPLQLQNSLREIEKVKTLIVGGGVVSKVLEQNLQNIKTKIYATYGMTETITHIAVKKLNHFNVGDLNENYKTLPTINVGVDDRNCLVIDAPNLANEKVVTNDVVELISDKEFKWLGRFDSVINSGGIKLIPEQIEEKIAHLIKHRFFLAGVSDSQLGEKLVLVIESNNYKVDTKKLRLAIKELTALGKYEIPKEIYTVDSFLETATSKIDKINTLKLF